MAIGLKEKQAIIDKVSEVAKSSVSAVAAEYTGLSVAQMTALRVKAREQGVHVQVVRNTLAKRALKGTDFECMNDELTGQLLLSFAEDPGAPARVLKAFAKENDALVVRFLSIGGKVLAANQIDVLAKLPTKDEAISRLMSVMQAPIIKFLRTLQEPAGKLVRTVVAIKEQKEAQA